MNGEESHLKVNTGSLPSPRRQRIFTGKPDTGRIDGSRF